MALSYAEKQRILNMLDRLDSRQKASVTRSETSLWKWLKKKAKWLWDKFTNTVIGNVINWLMGW